MFYSGSHTQANPGILPVWPVVGTNSEGPLRHANATGSTVSRQICVSTYSDGANVSPGGPFCAVTLQVNISRGQVKKKLPTCPLTVEVSRRSPSGSISGLP